MIHLPLNFIVLLCYFVWKLEFRIIKHNIDKELIKTQDKNGCCKSIIHLPLNFGEEPESRTCNGRGKNIPPIFKDL